MTKAAKSTEASSEHIKALREATGLTQVAFAGSLGVARSLLAECEGAGRKPSTNFNVRLGNFAAKAQRYDDALWFWTRAGIDVELLATVLDQASGTYRHPRLGEKRKHRKPLHIDRLSAEVKDAIIAARDAGQTWKEAADNASLKAGVRLSVTNVQRWYDLRIDQPEKEAQAKNASRREIVTLLNQILSAVSK